MFEFRLKSRQMLHHSPASPHSFAGTLHAHRHHYIYAINELALSTVGKLEYSLLKARSRGAIELFRGTVKCLIVKSYEAGMLLHWVVKFRPFGEWSSQISAIASGGAFIERMLRGTLSLHHAILLTRRKHHKAREGISCRVIQVGKATTSTEAMNLQ